jgi:hypothetical protein
MWDKGMRLHCPREKTFVAIVQHAMMTSMKITCTSFGHIALAYCCKIVDSKLNKLWHNQVSSYRVALKKCKLTQDCPPSLFAGAPNSMLDPSRDNSS